MSEHIKTITVKDAYELLKKHAVGSLKEEDKGRFLVHESNGSFTAIDNSTSSCWTEDFKTRFEAVKYLYGIGREV